MIVKKYTEHIPTVAEVYHQIQSMGALVSIRNIAKRYGLANLYDVTTREIDLRNNTSPSRYVSDGVSLPEILQKDAVALSALRDLYVCALEYRLLLFALSVLDEMLYYEEDGKRLAKKLIYENFVEDSEFATSDIGKALIVNLYAEPNDELSNIETVTLRRFFATVLRL